MFKGNNAPKYDDPKYEKYDDPKYANNEKDLISDDD